MGVVEVDINGTLEEARDKLLTNPQGFGTRFLFLTKNLKLIHPRREGETVVKTVNKKNIFVKILHGIGMSSQKVGLNLVTLKDKVTFATEILVRDQNLANFDRLFLPDSVFIFALYLFICGNVLKARITKIYLLLS